MANLKIFEMADRLKEMRQRKKELDAEIKELGSKIDELDQQLSDAMADAELDKFTRNGSTFYLSTRLYASPQEGLKDAMISALMNNGYAEVVTQTVNANTLASLCKELMAENADVLPPWLADSVNTFEKVTVGIRKS